MRISFIIFFFYFRSISCIIPTVMVKVKHVCVLEKAKKTVQKYIVENVVLMLLTKNNNNVLVYTI